MRELDRLSVAASAIQEFWLARGWVLREPWDGELTARSMSPPSFFAMAHPTSVRWVTRQVVRQPSEARYGRSPVRQVRSTQIRVLARPSPTEAFRDFVASLLLPEVGLDGHEVRLRPVEWRVRDLGVEGKGWMVLIDGLLVARSIDLVVVGGRAVEAATEMTYGLERLALLASEERSLGRLQRAHCLEYADQKASEEEELSRHLLESLDEAELMQDLERELGAAERALDERLRVPAYEAILRGVVRAEILRARGAFRTLREARAGIRLTELSAACLALASGCEPERADSREAAPGGTTEPPSDQLEEGHGA